MIVVGMALAWAGYTVGFYGFCLVKGYNVSFAQLVSPKNFYQGTWPPGTAPANVILPTGGATGTTDASQSGTNPVQKQQKKNLQGAAPNPHGTVQ